MQYVSTHEAARVLRVHVSTIREMIVTGRLPAIRLGRRWRVPAAALDWDGLRLWMETRTLPRE